MSVKIGKRELVALARDFYEEESSLDKALERCNDGFITKLEKSLWDDIREKYPDRDFTKGKESKTRANIKRRLKTVLKCKSLV